MLTCLMGKPKALFSDPVQQLQTGNRQAAIQLVELTFSSLQKFCFYLTSNAEKAEDIIQETYLRALSNIEHLKDPEAFRSWLFQIARNYFTDTHRKPETYKIDEHFEQALKQVRIQTDLSETVGIKEALNQLRLSEREALILVDQLGFTYAEAAHILEIEIDSLRSRLHRARKHFVQIYDQPSAENLNHKKKDKRAS